jgi:carbon storage regulator
MNGKTIGRHDTCMGGGVHISLKEETMLVLNRKANEQIIIASNITLTLLAVEGKRVRLGLDAPADVRLFRGELSFWLEQASPDESVKERD